MWMIKDKVDYRFGMGVSAKKSDDERESAISEENEATSNVTSATTDHRGDDVDINRGDDAGTNGQRVDDSFKLSMEGTEATPLPVTSKILQKIVSFRSLITRLRKS